MKKIIKILNKQGKQEPNKKMNNNNNNNNNNQI